MAEALKDMYDRAAVDFLAARIVAVAPKFPRKDFVREVAADLPPLELKARSLRIAAGLRQYLPQDYEAALGIILKSLGKNQGGGGIEGMGGFRFMPLLNFVGTYGLDEPALSLDALGELTLYFSGEFDIRPYLRQHPRLAFAKLQQLSRDEDWRRRRLASEGSRPRLPWGMGLPDLVRDPSPTLPILQRLYADPHENVRRSVANHLNDIARDHPDMAVEIAGRWASAKKAGASARKAQETLRPTIRHALRGLIKQGHPGALGLLGFEAGAKLALQDFKLKSANVAYGGMLEFSATLINRGKVPANLSIDYAVWHLRADGSLRPKVFKLMVREALPGESIGITKRHAIRPITTRRYYAGKQAVDIRVNGQVLGRCDFTLRM